MSKDVFTLKQVAQSIRKTIEGRYERTYWVKAEIYKMNLFPSGHAFPELVQRQDGKIVANMTGVIWKTNLSRITKQFEEAVKEPFTEGKEVLMEVKITFSELYGLSLHISNIDPNYSLGALHRLKLETIEKLNALGVLQKNQTLKLILPKRIAVISAESSKGLSDFMQVLQVNSGKYGIATFLFNATVQGDQAVESIIKALNRIEQMASLFDAVVIVRGGGAEVGMSCYDDFSLCKRIAEFPLPVLCGIGHSTNLTVAEMVAHAHAITPSVLASNLITEFEVAASNIDGIIQKLIHNSVRINQHSKAQFKQLVSSLNGVTKWRIERVKNGLKEAKRAIQREAPSLLSTHQTLIKTAPQTIKRQLFALHQQAIHQQTLKRKSMEYSSIRFIEQQVQYIQFTEKQLSVLNPKSVLARGYAIVRHNGKAIQDEKQLESGNQIDVQFNEGSKRATII